MAVPTSIPAKAANSVILKPADASQQTGSERKQKQVESATLPSQTPTDKSATSNTTPTKSDLAAVLLPVKVVQPPASAQLNVTIDNKQYQLNKTAELQKLLQQTAQVVIANGQAKLLARAAANTNQAQIQAQVITNQVNNTSAVQATPTNSTAPQPSQTVTTQLILLAQPIQLVLPPALEELAKQNGVSTQQLATLAARVQGYPLPTAVLAHGQLTFSIGTSIPLQQIYHSKPDNI